MHKCCWLNAESVRRILAFAVVIMSMGFPVVAKTQKSADSLPVYLNPNFNYSEFMRFDAPKPPMDLIYQSNGFLALRESVCSVGGA